MTRIACGVSVALLAIVVAWPAPAQDAKSTRRDLAMIPGDALAFVHLRAGDLWKHPMTQGLRDTIAKAGPKALEQFQKAAYPNPSTIDRLTLVAVMGENADAPPAVVGLLSFREPFEKAIILKTHMPKADVKSFAGKTAYVTDAEGAMIGVHFPDDKHIMISEAKMLEAYLSRPIVLKGAMSPAIQVADANTVTVAVNVKAIPIPPQALANVPENFLPLTKAERVLFTWDTSKPEASDVALSIAYPNEKAAADAEQALKEAFATMRAALTVPKQEMEKKFAQPIDGPRPLMEVAELGGALMGLGGINQLNDYLKNPPIRRVGNDFVLKATVSTEMSAMLPVTVPVLVGLLLPAVQKVREAAARAQSQNNLKQMALAMHIHHDAANAFPPPAIRDKDGKALLSWRVAILPYVEQEPLYKTFKLDEPWDSDHNKKLIPMMPKIYASPRVPIVPGMTVYKMFTGPETVGTVKGAKMLEITDGTSNTAMIAEAGDPVVWTKPEDLPFDSKKPLPKLELPGGIRTIMVALADGSVRALDLNRMREADMKNLIGKADGNIVNWD